MLKRVHGPTASILWNGITTGDATLTFNTLNVGCSGAWTTTDYINMTGGVGFKSNDDILRFKSGANATSAAITQGVHFDQDGMVRIYDGVNKKYFSTGLTAHGFTFGQCVRLGGGGTCQLAHGNAIEDAEVLGMVSEIINTKEFVVTMQGEVRGDFGNGALGVGGATLSPGTIYFLSGTAGNSGEITNQEPMVAGKIRKPMHQEPNKAVLLVLPLTLVLLEFIRLRMDLVQQIILYRFVESQQEQHLVLLLIKIQMDAHSQYATQQAHL